MMHVIVLSATAIAWLMYGTHTKPGFAGAKNWLYRLWANKYYFDAAYQALIVTPLLAFSRWGLWKTVDDFVIDGAVNGAPRLYWGFGSAVRFFQTGVARLYAYAMLVGLLAILAYAAARFALLR